MAARTKQCSKCEQALPLERFSRRASSQDGLQHRCKTCVAEYGRAHYRRNKDKYVERATRWQAEHKERRRQMLREWSLRTKYGISQADFDAILCTQGGTCPCGATENLVVDHCHSTGVVRGILCNPCNLAIGLLADCPSRFDALQRYLEGGDAQWLPALITATA